MFLHESDYLGKIVKEHLNVVQGSDSLRLESELEAQAEIESYLAHRFDIALIFIDITEYNFAVIYAIGDLVLLAPFQWEASKSYVADDLVAFKDEVFKNILATTSQDPSDATNWTKVGSEFDKFTALTAGSGKHVDSATDWKPGDIRKLLIRRYMVDISLYELHSRLNPRQIPEFRITRRDDAISYLKKVADPRKNITPDFPIKVFADKEGNDITWDSNVKINHGQDDY